MYKLKNIIAALGVILFMLIPLNGCKDSNRIQEIDTTKDLLFTIATEKNIYQADEDIYFSISLKNQSGNDLKIAYFFLFTPIVPTATNEPVVTEMPAEPYLKLFKNDDTVSATYNLGGYFEEGKHEIKFSAKFYLNYGQKGQNLYEIISNAVLIEVY